MSYSGLGADWVASMTPAPVPAPFDYLNEGVGMAELQRIAAETVTALLGQGAMVAMIRSTSTTPAPSEWVPPNTMIGAIWGGHNSAYVLASVVVSTIAANERKKPANARTIVANLAPSVVGAVTAKLLNNGDPAGCQIAFEQSLNTWKSVWPAIQVPAGYTPTGWCARDLVFGDSCDLVSICKWAIDSSGKSHAVPAPAPPPKAILAPPAPSALVPQPPPTHAQLDAASASDENAQALTEFATYMGAMKQARDWLTAALGIPVDATDAAMWGALQARGITAGEAMDWFVGCDAALDCFRQRMNRSLGEAEQRIADNRVKVAVGVAAVGAVGLAWWIFRGGGK